LFDQIGNLTHDLLNTRWGSVTMLIIIGFVQ
jgi:hypothetical protein